MIFQHANVAAAWLVNMAPVLITTVGVAHSAQAPASLIVWPVVVQLVALFSSPTADWESVVATALRRAGDDPTPGRLTVRLAVALSALYAAVLYCGLAAVFVRDLLAVPAGPADLGLHWAFLLLPVPALWVVRGYQRGALMAGHATRWLMRASAGHAVALVVALTALSRTSLPGVACAGLAMTLGLCADIAGARYGTWSSARRPVPARAGDRSVYR